MGAESSTLQSVESLNSTLQDIEEKLFRIEDIHLHHERTLATDDTVLVSGKKIQCKPNVSIIVGPILGSVGPTSARVLLETNCAAEINLFVFEVDRLISESRFVGSVQLKLSKGIPSATTVRFLMAQTTYLIYAGGVNAKDTLTKVCHFQTLPSDPLRMRMLLCHDGRVEQLLPNEINMWENVCHSVNAIDQIGVETKVHLVVHNGNFLSIDNIIKDRAISMLHLLLKEDTHADSWLAILSECEEWIIDLYRKCLTQEPFSSIAAKCGHLFLAGDGETARISSLYLSMRNAVDDISDQGSYSSEVDSSTVQVSRNSTQRLKHAQQRMPDDAKSPVVLGNIRRTREEASIKSNNDEESHEEMKKLLLGLLIRLARYSSTATSFAVFYTPV